MHTLSASDWLIALHRMKGFGWKTLQKVHDICGGFDHLPESLEKHRELLTAARVPWKKAVDDLLRQETFDWIRRLKQSEVNVLTVLDDNYPPLLREIPQPPWVLYVRGDISALHRPALSVVGTRQPTHYGRSVAFTFGAQLAKYGVAVVSGMARGIDSEAHRGVIDASGVTIAVLGCGVDVIYPRNNRELYRDIVQTGAVISEFPLGTQPHPGFFPQRNRIISGLTYGTIVVEAGEKSGSLITANFSADCNRDVFAIPGPITSPQSRGCHALIQQGAKCITCVEDVLEEYPDLFHCANIHKEEPASVQLTLEETTILNALSTEPIHLDVLCARTALPVSQIHLSLVSLQMKLLVRQLPGSQYVRL